MKKLLCFLIFVLFLGCSQSTNMFLGVGQALDGQSPKISITSPENGVYVNKSDITITGMCSDNVGVTRIRGEAGINETASVVTEEIKFSSVRERSWSVTFDKNDLERILNLWRSGLKVTFTFTCYDAAGNTTVEHLFLYVDVEQPTVIINRPEVRFTEAEKKRYEEDVESFKKDYDINKFEKVNSFVNKEFILKGYVDDDYSVKSTYINIYNATKKKQVGVTPVIFKDGTFIAGGNGVHGGVTGNSQSWEFKLDSTLFCPTEGWHVLEVVTEDDAGNEKRQFVDKDWIYINQAADIPKNNFTSFDPGFKLNAGNMIAGNGFDDDGMKEIWIKIVPESKADPETPYTEWKECNEAEYIVKKCADFAVGGQLGNWSLKVPAKAGNYIIYAVPVDIYGVAPQVPYEGIYTSYFSVASEEDPVVGIDGQFRGATIVGEEKITGFFYDNEKVTKITAKMKFDEQEEDDKPVVLYDSSKQENVITIDKTEDFSLMTGQVVVKHFFTWNFKTSDYSAFKVLQMTLKVEDNDDNYGEDAVTIYGDSERPVFVGEISPANNSDVKGTNIFSGKVTDNVGVVKVIIKKNSNDSKNSNNSNENTNTLSWECAVSAPVKNDGKYESTFESAEIYPNDFGGYIDSEFTVTAIDAAGNEANHIIFLKGDKNKAQIEFYDKNGEKQNSGSYATLDKIINIRITPHHFEDGTYRKISQVSYSLDGKTEKSLELGQYSGGYYSIPLKVSTLGENVSGDVTLQIKALDETNNDSPGTLYFIVDNEAPNGLSITSPMLKDKTFITDLTDDVAKINENDISYYQNQEMILKGTISDNYRINEAVLDFCKADGTLIHSVTLTYDEEGKLSVSDEKGIVTASSGIPGNFTLKIDTTKFDDGNYILKTTAYDAAGNSETWGDGETDEYYFKVLQEADKPRIIYNIDFDSEGKTVIFPETTLKGAVIDDDAIAEKGLRYIVLGEADNLPEEKVKEKFDASNDSDVKILKNIKSFTRQNWEIDNPEIDNPEIDNPEIDNPEIDNPKFKNVGTYYLYMEVKDNNGTKSEIYKKTIVVSSTEKPYIKSITAEKGTGGESNGYYSGNVNISVKAIGGEAPLSHIMFRITTSNSNEENNDTIKVDDAENSINFNVTDNANLEKWHKYTFREQIETTRTVTFSFDSKLFVAGKTETINVEVKCIANNVESQIVREKILIDNEGPTLQIASPVANASVNKKIEISVSCNDRGAGVEAVYVSYQTTPTKPTKLEDITSNLAESADSTRGKWYKLENIDGISWIGEFNSEIIHPEASEHSYDFTVATVDMLGNITFTQQPIKINQDLDRPIVRLQNLNLSTGGTILHKSGFIYGTISDDDGGNDIEIYVSENGVLEANDEEWGKNLYSNGSWEYTFNGDGEKKLAFKVVDSKGTTFISADNSGLTVPKIVDSTAQNQAASKFTIIVDTESPEMTDVYFNAEPNTEPGFPTSKDVDTSVWSNSFSEKTFGGTEKKIWFLIGGTDENGIKGCTLTATDQNSGVDIPDPNDTNRIKTKLINGTSFYKYEINISNVQQTLLTFKVEVKDKFGFTSQKSFTVNVDNTPPTVNINSHSDGSNVYGTDANTIRGTSVDSSNVEKIEYALTTDETAPESGYIEISNPLNWEIKFEDNDILNYKLEELYDISVDPKTGAFPEDTYKLYVWLKATDEYGNVSAPKKLSLQVLPNGDKPKVNIEYPLAKSVLGGRITVSGTTNILTSSVKEVYIQIDTNYNGSTFDSNWENKLKTNAKDEDLKDKVVTDSPTGVKGIKVTSSSKTNWRLNINENKTMKGEYIAVKAIAVSETGKYTESEIVVFTIDKDLPQFSDLKLVQYDGGNPVKTLEYEDEMWISGSGWKLECSIEDDSGIASGSIMINNKTSVDDKVSLNDGKKYNVKIPLSTPTSGFGTIDFTLNAKDMDEKSNEQTFIIHYDNMPPAFEVSELSETTETKRAGIENSSSGVYTIDGKFKESSADGHNQSGFERIAMYFTRTVDDTTYIIDPMLKKGAKGDDNRYDVNKLNNAGEKELISSDGMYWKEVKVSSVNGSKITISGNVPTFSENVPTFVRNGGLCKIGGAIYRIEDVDGKNITVEGVVPSTNDTVIYFAVAQVIDNTIIETGTTTFYDENNSIDYDDDDKMVEGVTRVGTTYNWTASINSENIFDGDVDIHFVAFDKAGNSAEKTVYGKVVNNTPRFAGVSFGTDDNGNNKIEDNELIKVYANSYVAGENVEGKEKDVSVNGKKGTQKVTMLNLPLEGNTSLMTIKGDTTVKAKIVGGNTKLQWQWKVGSGAWSTPAKDLASGSSFGDDIRGELVTTITTYDFVSYFKINDIKEDIDETTLNIKIVDGTENGSQEAEIAIKVKTALLDNTSPTVTINQFYWDSESENSLYKNSRANGHIELEGDLSSDIFKENTGIYDTDPKVSGKITISGTASDNVLLKALYVTIPGFTGGKNLNAGAEFKVAERNGDGTWFFTEAMNDYGWACEILNEQFTINSNTIDWKIHWDTEKISGIVDDDVNVQVRAEDRGYGTAGSSSVEYNNRNSGSASYQMDVVPYITGLSTTLTGLEKKNPSVYGRSALGKYPVYYYRKTTETEESSKSEKITLKGFNIKSKSTVTFKSNDGKDATATLNDDMSFTLPSNAKSGEIKITVVGKNDSLKIDSLNNINNNEAKVNNTASDNKSKYANAYNRQPNGQNNDILTDNVELAIWEINSKAAIAENGELSEVVMHVNPKNGMLGFAFAHSQDLASYPTAAKTTTRHPYINDKKQWGHNTSTVNEFSYHTWMTDWTGVNQIGFVYDKNGNVFGTNGGTDTYTPNRKTGRLGLISSHWGTISDTSVNHDAYTGYTNIGRLRLEYLGITKNGSYASNVNRFAKGDSTQFATSTFGNYTNLYMMYYDNTLGELKFKAGAYDNNQEVNNLNSFSWSKAGFSFGDFADDAYNEKDSDDGKNYAPNYSNISIVANQSGANGNATVRPGIYYSISVVPGKNTVTTSYGKTTVKTTDVVVAVWYDDTTNKTLWYSYLENPLDNAGNRSGNGKISTEWATPIAILDGHAGGYCAIKADDDGHIHIAAYSRNDAGSLYYAYLENYASTPTVVPVDSYGSQGQYITMEVAKDTAGNNIPYIGYYMNSLSYPKYAYLANTGATVAGVDENNMYTGNWETIMLPTTSTLVVDDINIGVYKDSDGKLQAIPTQSESAGTKSGIAGGNGTSNPIFGYGITQTGSGYVETAQLK